MNTLAHPHYETPRQRDRRRARADVSRWLDECIRKRDRWESAKILTV
ncbi:MAG: hypothetical protein JJ902_05385 [Roseibium sp.]|nr:hypothetical protein [Roseibium sp.]